MEIQARPVIAVADDLVSTTNQFSEKIVSSSSAEEHTDAHSAGTNSSTVEKQEQTRCENSDEEYMIIWEIPEMYSDHMSYLGADSSYVYKPRLTAPDESRLIEQVDPVSMQVVRRYKDCKQAAKTMQLKYDKVYHRCYNRGNKSTTLGNFYWRFQSPDDIDEVNECDYTPIDDLLKIRFFGREQAAAGISDETLEAVKANAEIPPTMSSTAAKSESVAGHTYQEDADFDPRNPAPYLAKGKVIEQLHPISKKVVMRYKGAKEASMAMRIQNAKLYMRCFNHSAKSTPLGNFYWRFYSPELDTGEDYEEMSMDDLLALRFMDNIDEPLVPFKRRKKSSFNPTHESASESDGQAVTQVQTMSQKITPQPFVNTTGSRSIGRAVEQLDMVTRKVLRRYNTVKEAAQLMQMPDKEKLYLRCYRSSGRTNSLYNFFWRFYSPAGDETDNMTEKDFVPIEDLLKIRFAPEITMQQNKHYSSGRGSGGASSSRKRTFEESSNVPGDRSDIDWNEDGSPTATGQSLANGKPAGERESRPRSGSGGNNSKSRNFGSSRSDLLLDDIGGNKYASKEIEQLDTVTKKVVRRYPGAKAAATAMDLPYDKVYLRCYNQKRRNVSTPLGNFFWRWYEPEERPNEEEVKEEDFVPVEELLEKRYEDTTIHGATARGSTGASKKRKKGSPADVDDFGSYDDGFEDTYTIDDESPNATNGAKGQVKAIEQVDIETGRVLRRYKTAKEAATAMQLPYNRLYLRCYNHGQNSTTLGNFGWRFHDPAVNGPDEVTEDQYAPITELLKIRYAGESEVADESMDKDMDSDDGFDARYEAAIEAAELSLLEAENQKNLSPPAV